MASLVEIEEEQKHEDVDALFALGINVRCVDLSWTYDKVLLTFHKASASLNSNPSLTHLPIAFTRYQRYTQDTIFWPGGNEKFNLCMNCVETESSFYSAGTFTTAEHGGTHVDAPYHFSKSGKTVEQLRLKDLIAPCFVIDVRTKCNLLIP